MNTKGKPNEIDIVIGQNIRKIREDNGLSQCDLADMIGVTYQQIQKYENAQNRIAASRLYILSKVLKVPLTDFYSVKYWMA